MSRLRPHLGVHPVCDGAQEDKPLAEVDTGWLWWDPPAPSAGGEGGWRFSVQSSTAAVTDVGLLPLLITSSHGNTMGLAASLSHNCGSKAISISH